MKTIPLTKGYVALVDDSDYERISAHKWFAIETVTGPTTIHVHAGRWLKRNKSYKRVCLRMHHEVLQVKSCILIDHKNRNGVDNQKHNLEVSNKKLNALNSDRSIKAKGIYYEKSRNRYKAFKLQPYKQYVGTFRSYEEAKEALSQCA